MEFVEGTVDDVTDEKLFGAATCMLVLHFIEDVDEKRNLLKKDPTPSITWRPIRYGVHVR